MIDRCLALDELINDSHKMIGFGYIKPAGLAFVVPNLDAIQIKNEIASGASLSGACHFSG
jgi:hypothetical protein